jgi:integrase
MSIELARPGVWRVRWREGNRNRSKVVGRRRDAEAFDAEVRRRRRLGELALMDRGTESFADFVQEWYAKYAVPNLEPKTIDLYEWLLDAHILPRLGALPLRELTPETITGWKADLAKAGLGVESQRKALKLLRGILQRAQEWRRISDNPARLVRLPVVQDKREVRPLPPENVEAMRAHLLREDRLDHAALVSLLVCGSSSSGSPGSLLGARSRENAADRAAYGRWTDPAVDQEPPKPNCSAPGAGRPGVEGAPALATAAVR